MYLPICDSLRTPDTVFTYCGGAALDGHHQADIVIVGQDIAEADAGLYVAEGGAKVALLEAHEIGWGSSSRYDGHVAAATKLWQKELNHFYGPGFGPRLAEASEIGSDFVFHLAERHQMDGCPLRRPRPSLLP